MASPAWQTQRSLPIVTWDEDESQADDQVAAVVAGSQGSVRAGYGDSTRYDHYSTGRTIENALGLAPITANDRYATPLNGAFGTPSATTLSTSTPSVSSGSPLTFHYATPAADSDATNWIGICPAGDTPGVESSTSWQSAPDPSGTVTFSTSGFAAGSYDAWYCYHNGYAVLAGPDSFTVTN
jgi:hypothetical protein